MVGFILGLLGAVFVFVVVGIVTLVVGDEFSPILHCALAGYVATGP